MFGGESIVEGVSADTKMSASQKNEIDKVSVRFWVWAVGDKIVLFIMFRLLEKTTSK